MLMCRGSLRHYAQCICVRAGGSWSVECCHVCCWSWIVFKGVHTVGTLSQCVGGLSWEMTSTTRECTESIGLDLSVHLYYSFSKYVSPLRFLLEWTGWSEIFWEIRPLGKLCCLMLHSNGCEPSSHVFFALLGGWTPSITQRPICSKCVSRF